MKPYYEDERVTLHHGDCLDVLRSLPDASVDAVVTDPPYLLGFMGREWDTKAGYEHLDWHRAWCDEAYRVLKPGGHMLAFGGTRTWHRLACAVEDAGFEVRDSIAWLYGSGFPKSLDVSKAIDRAAGATREVVGFKPRPDGTSRNYEDWAGASGSGATIAREGGDWRPSPDTAPATPDAERWQGWGTALKPAFEPVVVARKPLAGTVAANVLAHGTGALNIDGCRVGTDEKIQTAAGSTSGAWIGPVVASEYEHGTGREYRTGGRWPANVVLDESQAAALDEQSGESASPAESRTYTRSSMAGIWSPASDPSTPGTITNGSIFEAGRDASVIGYGDTGGASRFFPTFRYEAKAPSSERPRVNGVAHPTVKPLDLMRWLVRLVTPPGGTVLEPFAGSGATVEACIVEGFRCIAIEREADYLPLILQRIHRRRDPVAAIRQTGDDLGLFELDGEPA